MNGTKNRMNEAESGLQKKTGSPVIPRPWEIAAKLLPADGGSVTVEKATDEQFQAFAVQSGIPVDDSGIPEWSFDDRIRFISHAIRAGLSLPFVEQNNSDSGIVCNAEPAQEEAV